MWKKIISIVSGVLVIIFGMGMAWMGEVKDQDTLELEVDTLIYYQHQALQIQRSQQELMKLLNLRLEFYEKQVEENKEDIENLEEGG